MSVEKSHLIRKAYRGFDAIADAIYDDEDISKGIPKAIQARGTGGAYGTARRKANRAGQEAARALATDAKKKNFLIRARGLERKVRGAEARDVARKIANEGRSTAVSEATSDKPKTGSLINTRNAGIAGGVAGTGALGGTAYYLGNKKSKNR